MKRLIALLFLLLSTTHFLAQEKILFIGNSMTYFNDMPNLFQSVANSKGKNVQTSQYAPSGTGFVNHVNDANVYALISSQQWNAVVLQPGTGESGGATWAADSTISRGQRLIDSIKVNSPCAKIILYEISNGIASSGSGGNYPNYFVTQTRIKDTITKIATGLQIPMAPAGECFRAHYTNTPDLLLHSSYNDVHPNLNGSYLVACSIFNTLYQENVQPCTFYGGINETTATYLQNISDTVVLTNEEDWLINVFNLHADFSSNINETTVQLENLSNNFDSVLWDINGEYSTTATSPTYSFSSPGVKTIILTAFKNGCTETITKQIEIFSLGIHDNNELNKFVLYPNPTSDLITIKTEVTDDLALTISDLSGKTLIFKEYVKNKSIDVSFLEKGIYLIQITHHDSNCTMKLIKE